MASWVSEAGYPRGDRRRCAQIISVATRAAELGLLDDDLVLIAGITHTVIEADRIFIVASILYGFGIGGGVFPREAFETALLYKYLALGHAGFVWLVPQTSGQVRCGVSRDR